MSHFYGRLWGNRKTVTRCGGRNNGIHAELSSWNNKINASLNDENGKDIVALEIPSNLIIRLNCMDYIIKEDGHLKEIDQLEKDIILGKIGQEKKK